MPTAKLTKSQRRRANERRRKQADRLFHDTVGPMPEYPKELLTALGSNLESPLARESWEKAPAHLVDYDEHPSLKDDELVRMSRLASNSRTQKRSAQISKLKLKYPDQWGKPS